MNDREAFFLIPFDYFFPIFLVLHFEWSAPVFNNFAHRFQQVIIMFAAVNDGGRAQRPRNETTMRTYARIAGSTMAKAENVKHEKV
jgi:hypothetical protein